MIPGAAAAFAGLLLALSQLTNAECECGYSINKTSDAEFAVFTDLMENDFLHTNTDDMWDVGWRPQQYSVSNKDSRGPFGKNFTVDNVETNPLKDPNSWSGESENGGDAGLQLWVRGDSSNGYVSGAEMATERRDCRYGSFRVGMKLASANGTCGAFFYFFNNSQEIDLEFLNKQFNNSQGAVNLVLQTPESVQHGYDASNTSGFSVRPLPFRPDEKFHEYRFDWTPERVTFYVDGVFLWEMTEGVPIEGGNIFMNHWSNGDPLWSAGPPGKDTPLTVSYIKAYFNSTEIPRQDAFKDRCGQFDPAKVCQIPRQDSAPDGANAKTYFFSQDGGNKTPGQTVFSTTNGASSFFGSSTSIFTYLPLLAALFWTISL